MTGSTSPSESSSDAPHPSAFGSSAFAAEPAARAVFRPLAPSGPWASFDCESIELISRGDIVNGVRVRPRGHARAGAKSALLLLAHDAGESTHAPQWSAVAPWVARGLEVAVIDLPLLGRRASAKLSERLVGALASLARDEALDRNGRLLVDEFRRQAVCDLARTRDALIATGAYDPDRIGLLAFGVGAWVADALLEMPPRFAAAALVATDHSPDHSPAHAPAPATPGGGSAGPNVVVVAGPSRAAWTAPAERALSLALGF